MFAPRSRLAVVLASLPLAIVCGSARPAHGEPCAEAISAENAEKLFDALKAAKPGNGCHLSGVRTEGWRATVVWEKGGALQEGILVAPTACVASPTTRGKVLSALVPPSTAAACPEAAQGVSAVVAGDTFVGLETTVVAPPPAAAVPAPPAPSPLRLPPPSVIAALAVALIVAAAFALRRRLSPLGAALRRRAGVVLSAAARVWASLRRQAARNPSRAGWGAAILLGPHLVLGTWLLAVPDHLAFTAAQIVTLAHVGLALVSIPAAVAWIVWHARGMRGSRSRAGAGERAVRWLLAGAAVVAGVTGLAVLRGGDIASTAALHAACGVAVGLPLAVHLWIASRRWQALGTAGLLLASTAGAEAARRWLPPAPAAAPVPAFAYETHPEPLYEPAEDCAECHDQDYRDWRRSVHARTLEMRGVQESMVRESELLDENLTHIGEILAEKDSDRPVKAALVFGACGSCHAPVTFYGDGKPSLPHATGVAAEGTGCSFCHTLREVRISSAPSPFAPPPRAAGPSAGGAPPPEASGAPGARPTGLRPTPGDMSRMEIFEGMSRAPLFVSAPETVRRYLGQGSKSALARRISSLLIRWRPQVHARDYHSPVLDDSRACLPCHSLGVDSPDVPHMTYYGWEHSAFNTGDPKTTVECQDCHMARRVTGEPVNEWARMVPWGPERPRARSHLFLGGNVQAVRDLGDTSFAAEEHVLNTRAASVSVAGVARTGDTVNVTVAVRSELVGHYFPALETKLRYVWVELRALDAAGNVLGRSPRPRDSEEFGCASPLIMASVTDPKPDNQRLIAPRSSRRYQGRITVPASAAIDRVVADLHVSVDPDPIATATWSQRGEP